MASDFEQIQATYSDSIQAQISAASVLPGTIEVAGNKMIDAIMNNKKILVCGNGGSAASAQYFAAKLLNRFEIERPSLPAIALTTDTTTLTAIANDYHFNNIFSKQISALSTDGDILFVITNSGDSTNIIEAIKMAQQKNMIVILLTGEKGGKIVDLIRDKDIKICIPSDNMARIQENHIVIIHCLCGMIDRKLFLIN